MGANQIMKPMHEIENMFDEDYHKKKRKTRKIKPHKGGRDQVLRGRFTEAEKAQIEVLKKKCNLSFSDLVMMLVNKENTP